MKAESALPVAAQNDDAWTAAAERVEGYLRAHRLTSERQLGRLTVEIINTARARQQPGDEPLKLAMETMDAGLAAWFAPLLAVEEARHGAQWHRGRLALAMGEVPARWPEYFLRDGAVPAELVRVMRESDLGRSPEIKLSNMAPRQPAVAAGTGRVRLQLSYRWPFVRVVTGLMVVATFIGVSSLAPGL